MNTCITRGWKVLGITVAILSGGMTQCDRTFVCDQSLTAQMTGAEMDALVGVAGSRGVPLSKEMCSDFLGRTESLLMTYRWVDKCAFPERQVKGVLPCDFPAEFRADLIAIHKPLGLLLAGFKELCSSSVGKRLNGEQRKWVQDLKAQALAPTPRIFEAYGCSRSN